MPVKFVETAVLCGIAFFVGGVSLRATCRRARKATVTFWSVAILLRMVVLPLEPGDDIWRYQWEGKVQNAGFNPYVLAPNDRATCGGPGAVRRLEPDQSPRFQRDLSAGSGADFRRAQPLRERARSFTSCSSPRPISAPSRSCLRLIGGRARHADAAWYAWNPLVVYSFAGAAHFDSLMILPMLAGIFFFARSNSGRGADRPMAPCDFWRGRAGHRDFDQTRPVAAPAGLRFRAWPPRDRACHQPRQFPLCLACLLDFPASRSGSRWAGSFMSRV